MSLDFSQTGGGTPDDVLDRSTGSEAATGNFTKAIIFRLPNGYTSGDFIQIWTWGDSDGNPAINLLTDDTGTDTIDVSIYDGVGNKQAITTGAYTGWLAIAITHATGSTAYKVYKWLEGDNDWTLAGTITLGAEATPMARSVIGASAFQPTDTRVYKVFQAASEYTAAQLLVWLRNAAAYDGSGDNTWLELASAASAATNEGTGGNFSLTGTPGESTDTPALPGHAHQWFAAVR